jgi:hypothetical protein
VDVVTDVDVFVLVLKIVDVLKTVTEIEQIPLDVDDVFDVLLLLLDFEELGDELDEEQLLSALLCVSARELVALLLLSLEALSKALEV